jgi:hypothetical protein
MCALGLRFTLSVSRSVQVPALLGLVTKMAALPGLVYVVAVLVGSPHDLAW